MTHTQQSPTSIADYVERGILTSPEADALRQAIIGGESILIGGRTNAGKTTLVRALLRELPTLRGRTVIVQHTREIASAAQNQVSFLVSPPHYTDSVAVSDAVRLRPDHLVLDDVLHRAAEALFRPAQPADRPCGLLATIHAYSCAEALQRLCHLIDERGGEAARQSVARTFGLCVHVARDRTGSSVRVQRLTKSTTQGGWGLMPLQSA